MAAKGEISWKRRTPEGERWEVFAHHVGTEWVFYARSRRYEQWKHVPKPPLEDWMELLDGIRRRVGRRLLRPEEVQRVERRIQSLFPEVEF